jgi:hypothetical protein
VANLSSINQLTQQLIAVPATLRQAPNFNGSSNLSSVQQNFQGIGSFFVLKTSYDLIICMIFKGHESRFLSWST